MKKAIWTFVRARKWWLIGGLALCILILGVVYFSGFNRHILTGSTYSTTFLDRRGIPLRTLLSTDEQYAERCALSEVSPHFLRAIVLIEDKRFYSHHGVVVSSLMRAFWQNLSSRRVVSGGSTITMQLCKLIYRHRSRSLFNKAAELLAALKFELHLSKREILEEYINRLPFGNMIYGVKEACRFYFEKKPADLSLNQAIYLALIPKSPSRYNPARNLKVLKERWVKVLQIFRENRQISEDEYQRAKNEGIDFAMKDYPFVAPHFIELVKERYLKDKIPDQVSTTLDSRIQREMEGIVREHLVRLKDFLVKSAAVVIIDNQTHEVIGFLGSPDYFNDRISGFVNLAVSLRQPGSTLKPFVYALALESGYTPATILPDIRFPSKGGFFPKNHDGLEHGPLRLRVALACSYNIPAFYLAMKLTPARVIDKLHLAGFGYIQSDPGFYGETIALGAAEVNLLDLTTAYSAFANGGVIHYPAFLKGQPIRTTRLFDERAAYLTWHILADPAARFASFGYDSSMKLPFPLAVKTGTSKGFRDKWAVGVNACYTVGVWVGNPAGENMRDLTEVGNAATVMRDIFLAIQPDWTKGDITMPAGIVKKAICPLSGELLTENCRDAVEEYFMAGQEPQKTCSFHVRQAGAIKVNYPELYRRWASRHHREGSVNFTLGGQKKISFPQRGDFFSISAAVPRQAQQITFEVMGFSTGEKVEFYLDGRLYRAVTFPTVVTWPLQRGDHTLGIKSNGETLDSVRFIVR